ncbi:MAG: lactate utilization protein [Clostridia bacterium]|nr:lactate utilization protein [Clostridia bacterium]MBQ4290828.1 lactate utilization protein [Clostridia bacterium]
MESNNPHLNRILEQQLERTAKALRENRMEAVVVGTKQEARDALERYLFPGCTIGVGGSATLDEIDALTLFRSPAYRFFDRYTEGMTDEERKQIFREAMFADVFAMSSNAITETGLLYNVDGRCNRVAPLLYGPQSVVVVAGCNKIVPDLPAAVARVMRVAAPANAVRLGKQTPCATTGICAGIGKGDFPICEGCQSPDRICSGYVISARQLVPNRIKVILVAEPLGF